MALRLIRIVTTAVAAALVVATVGAGGAAGATRSSAPKYAAAGPYGAGVTTLSLPDRKVEVWYPTAKKAARGAVPAVYDLLDRVPPAIQALLPPGTDVKFRTGAVRDLKAAKKRGAFPLVLMTHGVAGYREQLSYLASHLASWGFVVVSPDILERGLTALLGSPPAAPRDDLAVMRDSVALVRAENERKGGPLAGRVQRDTLAVTGQSAGGSAALRFAGEPGVVTAIPISASGFDRAANAFLPLPAVPTMFVTGAADQFVPVANVEAGFQKASPPTRFVAIEGAGHASVTDICPIGTQGGLVGVAERANLPVPPTLKQLAADGCQNPAPNPDPAWPVVRHVVTAQLREAFGIDKKPVGLDAKTMAEFAPVVVRYQERR